MGCVPGRFSLSREASSFVAALPPTALSGLARRVPAVLALSLGLAAAPAGAATVTLTTSPNPAVYNETVTLRAVVSDTTAPTGSITFRETGVATALGNTAVATARYTKVVAGGANTCGIVSDTTLECWGNNLVGQLGNGTTTSVSLPQQVPGLIGVTDVEIGNDSVCAVLSDKTVKCWGDNTYGQVGNTTGGQITTPRTVSGLTDVTAVEVGTQFACALKSDATVVCWGRNVYGQLGNGGTTDTNTPTAVPGLTNVTALTAGYEFACALKSDQTVSCWGRNNLGQLGAGDFNNSSSPRGVTGLSNVATISAGGGYQVCALLTDATARCWGRNDFGQLGTGTAGTNEATPQTVTGLAGITNITSGNGWSCAALSSGNPKCWGFNYYGALAQGFADSLSTTRPTPLDTPAYAGAVYFAFGGNGGCAILADDTIKCAGLNTSGQLGNGTTADPQVTVMAVVKTFTKSVASITRTFSAGSHTLNVDFTPTFGSTIVSADVVQTINKATQTVTFADPSDTTVGVSPITLSASASSGLTVSFAASPSTVCTVSGNQATIVGAGTCTITASQGGDDNSLAASDVSQSFTVGKGSQTITFTDPSDVVYGSGPVTLSASAPLTVSFAASPSSVCTVSGNQVTLVGVGTCTIDASQAGNSNYNPASDVTQSFDIGKAAAGVALNAPSTARVSQSVALGAVVSATPAGAGAPAGTVEFLNGSDVIASATTVNGIAVARVSTLGLGDHTLSARFVETALFTGATTGGQVLRVEQAGTRVLMSPSAGLKVRPGQTATVTAYVQPTGAARGIPDGSITFSADGSTIATDALTAGVARRTIETQVSGNHVITGAYGGSADFEASSGTVALTVDARLGSAVAPDSAGGVASEETPAMAELSNGGTAVVWSGVATGSAIRSIHGRVFGPSGAAVGSVFALGEATDGLESRPKVARLFGGRGAVAVWQTQDTTGVWTVRARRFGENGVAIGPSLRIDTGAGSTVEPRPVVAPLAFGGYLVVWRGDADGGAIMMRRFTVGGTPRAAAVRIDDAATGAKSDPAVTAYADGGFLAVYAAARPSPATGSEIRGVVVPAKGSAGAEVALSPSADSATNPSLPATVGASRLVLYTRNLGAGLWAVDGRGLTVSGTTLTTAGASFRLDTDGAGDAAPAVASYPGGGFVAAWTEPGASAADDRVKIARYRADGEVVDPPQTVLARETRTPALSVRSDVAYTLTLQASPLLGGDPSINLQRFLLAAPVPPG